MLPVVDDVACVMCVNSLIVVSVHFVRTWSSLVGQADQNNAVLTEGMTLGPNLLMKGLDLLNEGS